MFILHGDIQVGGASSRAQAMIKTGEATLKQEAKTTAQAIAQAEVFYNMAKTLPTLRGKESTPATPGETVPVEDVGGLKGINPAKDRVSPLEALKGSLTGALGTVIARLGNSESQVGTLSRVMTENKKQAPEQSANSGDTKALSNAHDQSTKQCDEELAKAKDDIQKGNAGIAACGGGSGGMGGGNAGMLAQAQDQLQKGKEALAIHQPMNDRKHQIQNGPFPALVGKQSNAVGSVEAKLAESTDNHATAKIAVKRLSISNDDITGKLAMVTSDIGDAEGEATSDSTVKAQKQKQGEGDDKKVAPGSSASNTQLSTGTGNYKGANPLGDDDGDGVVNKLDPKPDQADSAGQQKPGALIKGEATGGGKNTSQSPATAFTNNTKTLSAPQKQDSQRV